MGLTVESFDGHVAIFDGDDVVESYTPEMMAAVRQAEKEVQEELEDGGEEELEYEGETYEELKVVRLTSDLSTPPSSELETAEPCGKNSHSTSVHISTKTYAPISMDKLKRDFNTVLKAFKHSHRGHSMIKQLQRFLAYDTNVKVTNIVALGTGSLHLPGFNGHSWIQLAAVMVLRDSLSEIIGARIPCVIQDPAFSEVEKDFMRDLGLELVDDPDAFLRINAESLVFSVCTENSLAIWMSYGAWPAAMITEDRGRLQISSTYHIGYCCCESVRRMFAKYHCEPFADLDHSPQNSVFDDEGEDKNLDPDIEGEKVESNDEEQDFDFDDDEQSVDFDLDDYDDDYDHESVDSLVQALGNWDSVNFYWRKAD